MVQREEKALYAIELNKILPGGPKVLNISMRWRVISPRSLQDKARANMNLENMHCTVSIKP